MDLATALQNIQANRKAILFLGAGFSNSAKNLVGLSTPSGTQLAARILEFLKIPGTASLGLAVDKLREKLPPQEAFDFITNQLTVEALTPDQTSVLALPWTRIYTTNVDNIGSALTTRTCHDAAIEDNPVGFGNFVYLHGSVTNCTSTNYYKNLKLGEQLYLANARSGSGYLHMLKQDLYECDSAFVIGYSMADPNLAEIFFNSEDLLNKCFVFSGHADELSAHRISLIGTNTDLGMADLDRLVKERPANAEIPIRSDLIADRGSFDTKEVTQTARQNMLIYGRFDANTARTNWVSGGPTYVIKRKIADHLADLASPCVAVVHSHLGNGKSLIFEYARFQLARQGKTVFTVKPEVSRDALLDALAEVPAGSYVFFEGDIFSVADAVKIISDRSLVLCATARTTTFRVALPILARAALGSVSLQTFDANQLNNTELNEFHDLIDSMGFWPEDLAQAPPQRRLSKLKGEFDSNVSAIILKIFENENVRSQVLAQWNTALVGLRPIMDHFIVASYMQMIDISVPSYILNEFQNMDFNLLSDIQNDIIKVSHSGRVSFGNSIVGEFVFRNHPKKNDIIGAVVRFANFVNGHSSQRSLQWIVRRLLRYWNLRRLLGSSTSPNDVLDRASHVPSVNGDPLFWVQYSIAQMENNNFLPAERYLETAYARAKSRGAGFDAYQIDTHSARLVIRKIDANGIYDGFSKDTLEAVGKLRAVIQRRSDAFYHVATVVSLMLNAEVNWRHVLNDRDFRIFKRELETIGQKLVIPAGEVSFVPEREAIALIQNLVEGPAR